MVVVPVIFFFVVRSGVAARFGLGSEGFFGGEAVAWVARVVSCRVGVG